MLRTGIRLLAVLAAMTVVGLACRESAPDAKTRELARRPVYPSGIKGEPTVRVLVADGLQYATLSLSGPYALRFVDLAGQERAGGGREPKKVALKPTAAGLAVGDDEVREAVITPLADTLAEIAYRDPAARDRAAVVTRALWHSVTLSRSPGGGVRVVARLGMEEYLVGVLPAEMPTTWPIEALKAQAVASRSYALYHVKTRAGKDFDLFADTRSQMWTPRQQPNPRAVMAVNATRGVVMLDGDRLFPAFFHAKCGGFTANADGTLLKQDVKALWSARCPYCYESKEDIGSWRFSVPTAELSARLKATVGNDRITAVRALDRYSSPLSAMGRVDWVELQTERGQKKVLAVADFRQALGAGKSGLASTWFEVAKSGARFDFVGKGSGHGVGMCQWGAWYCADKLKWSYRDILNRYYTGHSLVQLWGE